MEEESNWKLFVSENGFFFTQTVFHLILIMNSVFDTFSIFLFGFFFY